MASEAPITITEARPRLHHPRKSVDANLRQLEGASPRHHCVGSVAQRRMPTMLLPACQLSGQSSVWHWASGILQICKRGVLTLQIYKKEEIYKTCKHQMHIGPQTAYKARNKDGIVGII